MHIYKWRQRKMTKSRVTKQILNYFAIIIGTFLLSFGAVIFLERSNLVSGGVSGIAIVVQYIARQATGNASLLIYDYVIYGLMIKVHTMNSLSASGLAKF